MFTATTVQDMMREMAGLSYFVPSLPCAPKTQIYEYPLAQFFLNKPFQGAGISANNVRGWDVVLNV